MAGAELMLMFTGSLLFLGFALFVLLWLGKRLRLEGPQVVDSFIKEGWFTEEEYLKAMTMCGIMCDCIYCPWCLYHSEKSF